MTDLIQDEPFDFSGYNTFSDFENNVRGNDPGSNEGNLRQEFFSLTVEFQNEIVAAIERWNALQAHFEDCTRKYNTYRSFVAQQLAQPALDAVIVERHNILAKNCFHAAGNAARTLVEIYKISHRNTYRGGVHPASYAWTNNRVQMLRHQQNILNQQITDVEARIDRVGRKIPNKYRNHNRSNAQRALMDQFQHQPLYPDQNADAGFRWRCMDMFAGGLSRAGLWVMVDGNDIVHDRIVKKTLSMDPQDWLSSLNWQGNPRDLRARVPLEVHLQQKCWEAANHLFPNIRGWNQDHKNLFVSIYVEFCAQGDLSELLTFYFSQKPCFPEPFIWLLMLRLVESCMIMQQGSIDGPLPGWRQIIHRDIKSNNVFMDSCPESGWCHYPVPKLADFGLAVETDDQDPLNPSFYNSGSGTAPYRAPEQRPFINNVTGEPVDDHKLSDATNVYAICAVMFELVSHKRMDHELDFLPGETPWTLSNWTMSTYTPQLLQPIMSGLAWDPRSRPSSTQLRATLLAAVDQLPANMAHYIKASEFEIETPADWYALDLKPDQYQYKMAAGVAPIDEGE